MDNLKDFLKGWRFWGPVVSLIAIALISFSYFYPDAAQGNVLRQHDMQQGLAIGQEAKAFAEATGETTRWTNSLFSGMPTFQISPSYPSNDLFSWINSVMGLGLPDPANLLCMMMVGFFILGLAMKMRWYVALIGAIGYGFSSYFIIIIGAGHLWKFITLAYIPPTIAGIVMCYRGRYLPGGALAAVAAMMQIASNHVQMSYYFLAVVIGFAVAYFCKAYKRHTLPTWAKATATLIVAAALAVTANLPSLYNTYEYSKETMRGNHSELTQTTDPTQATSGLDRNYITQYSYGTAESFSLLIPNIKGGASIKPEKGSVKMLSLGALPEAGELVSDNKLSSQEANYLEYVSQYFGEPEGTNGPVYVGALIAALFLLGCVIVKGPVKWMLLALTVLSVLLALGRNFMWLTDLMIDYMPMYSRFRTVESILVIAEFTMPLLAAMALQQIVTAKNPSKQFLRPTLWCFGIILGLCALGILFPGIYGNVITDSDRQTDAMIQQALIQQGADANTARYFSLNNPNIYSAIEHVRHAMIEADALRSFIICGAGAALLLLFMYRKLSMALMIVGVGIIVCGDLFLVNKRYLDSDSFVPRTLASGDPFPMSDADRQIMSDTAMNYRVMDLQRFWQPDPSYRHKAIGGYHAAKLTRYQDMIDRHLGNFLDGSQDDADWNVLNMLNARYIVDFSGRPIFNDEAYGNAWIADTIRYVDGANAEMDALSAIDTRTTAVADSKFKKILGNATLSAPGDTIFETSYAPNRLTYHANSANGGIAVFSEVFFPWGWEATVDGNPAELGRVNYILRALRIPAGSHSIEMKFNPKSIQTTTTAAYIAIILIYIALVAAIGLSAWVYCNRTKTAS